MTGTDNGCASTLDTKNGRAKILILVAIFLLLSIVFTRDVILFIADSAPCGAGDSMMFAWNFWWIAEQLKEGKLFFKCDYAMLPFGIRTVYHTALPLHCVLLAPVTWLLGPLVSSNLHLILSFAIGGLGMALLIRFLTCSYLAGLCGGIVYAFSTFHWYHAIGHYNQTATELLPFCILFLLKWGRDSRVRDLAIASGLLGLNLYNDYTTTIVLGICAAPLFGLGVFRAVRERELKKTILALTASMLLFAVIASPVFYHAREFSSLFDDNWRVEPGLAVRNSPDALSYLLPDGLVWFSVPLFKSDRYVSLTGGGLDRAHFFGIFALALSILGAIVQTKQDRRLALCLLLSMVVCFLLSLGPKPSMFGEQIIPAAVSPFTLLSKIPFLSDIRIPGRFGLGVALVGAVFVGIGAARLFSRTADRERIAILLVLVAGLLFLERVHKPIFGGEIRIPPIYKVISELSPKPKGILTTPFHTWSGQGMTGQFSFADPAIELFYQTDYRIPTVNGFAARIPREIVSYCEQAPLTSSLIALQNGRGVDAEQILAEKTYVEEITYLFGISHVVCDYRADYWLCGLPMKRYLEDILLGKLVYSGDSGRIYDLPQTATPPREVVITPDTPSARLYLMEGWHKPVTVNGRNCIAYDPCRMTGSHKSRMRMIFRTEEDATNLEYSYQFSPAFPDRYIETRYEIDLDGDPVGEFTPSSENGFAFEGVHELEPADGIHYLTLTPLDFDHPASSLHPSGLSDRAIFVEQIHLNW
ncbi:MAG: hypothetical protein JW941_07230 [Candidatus Coatesbacteria bacterium]|nr:hypothetical protein [Candidatus Coatesbacteria bacterium]